MLFAMILADKIIDLRKREGLSQEQLAAKLGVSRQSVSKWEGAQSTPDMDKIIKLADLFGVSTDYLLRDEIESLTDSPANAQPDASLDEAGEPLDPVSMEEANAFLDANRVYSARVALGVALCVASSVVMFVLEALQAADVIPVSEDAAISIGIIVLLVLVGIAVALFIVNGMRMKPYNHLKENALDTAYGVDGMVRERREASSRTRVRSLTWGVVLCVVSCIPFFLACAVSPNDFSMMMGVAFILLLIAGGVYLIVYACMLDGGYKMLLEEEDYSRDSKRFNKKYGGVYWGVVTGVYLIVSFLTMAWVITWVIWPVAGVAYGVFAAVKRAR